MDISCVRFYKNDMPYDAINSSSVLFNFGVSGVEAKFPANVNNAAGWFKRNGYVVNAKDYLNMRFPEMFSVIFWAKFVNKTNLDDIDGNRFMIILNDNTIISATIPSTVTVTDWNQYTIVRDQNNVITLRINGTTVASDTSTAEFNLTGNSYVYLGNENRYCTGSEIIADDILIIDAPLYEGDYTTLPTDYIDVSQFSRCLYIVVSTGEVWGYKAD